MSESPLERYNTVHSYSFYTLTLIKVLYTLYPYSCVNKGITAVLLSTVLWSAGGEWSRKD